MSDLTTLLEQARDALADVYCHLDLHDQHLMLDERLCQARAALREGQEWRDTLELVVFDEGKRSEAAVSLMTLADGRVLARRPDEGDEWVDENLSAKEVAWQILQAFSYSLERVKEHPEQEMHLKVAKAVLRSRERGEVT